MTRGLVGVGAGLAMAVLAGTVQGQETTVAPPLIFTLPAIAPPTGERTITRDDLRDPPASPRMDRLPSSVSASFIMDDGQCLPGESAAFRRSRRDGRVGQPARPR
jgi:hypothetical protein